MSLPDAIQNELDDAVAAGREAFSGDEWKNSKWAAARVTVSADVVKRLVIDATADNGVQIFGAEINGLIDLRDARGRSGVACNALILRSCDLVGRLDTLESNPGIDASNSHLRRLSLVDCTTDGVELTGAVIDGDLALDGIRPCTRDGVRGACWVKARGARVGGSVTAGRAELRLPWGPAAEGERPKQWKPREGDRYWHNVTSGPFGLDLRGSQITGSLLLWPDFKSVGGVNLRSAIIGGRLVAAGAQLDASGTSDCDQFNAALDAQLVQVQGPVFLCNDDIAPFKAGGALDFYGAKIGGAVEVTGAEVTVLHTPSEPDWPIYALNLYAASLAAQLTLWDSTIPTVDLSDATIEGSVRIWAPNKTPIERVNATTLRIGGDLNIAGSVSSTDLSGSTIDGQVVLGLADDPLTLTSVNGSEAVLRLADARVGRSLKVVGVDNQIGVSLDWKHGPVSIRTFPLACYEKWVLAEALFKPTSGSRPGILAFLYDRKGSRIVILDGTSDPMRGLSEDLALGTPKQATHYLTLFCAYVWGDEGAFTILPDGVDPLEFKAGQGWMATARIRYGSGLFDADFLIETSGSVTMLDDRPSRDEAQGHLGPLYARPIRQFEAANPGTRPFTGAPEWPEASPPLGSETDWAKSDSTPEQPLSPLHSAIWNVDWPTQEQLSEFRQFISSTDPWPVGLLPPPQIDLEGLKVASLHDSDGKHWFASTPGSALQLILTGFEYDRIIDERGTWEGATDSLNAKAAFSGKAGDRSGGGLSGFIRNGPSRCVTLVRNLASSAVRRPVHNDPRLPHRLTWLKAQYPDYPPAADEYKPQPYQQLARVWRAAGNFEDADEIAYQKLLLEKVKLGLDRRSEPGTHTLRWISSAIAVAFVLSVVVNRTAGASVLVVSVVLFLLRMGFPSRAMVVDHWCKQHAWKFFVQWPFGFGLKPRRALLSFVVFWAVGVLAVSQKESVLVLDTSAVGTVVQEDTGGERVVVPVEPVVKDEPDPTEILCRDQVSKIIYPLDVAIPLIDLREESRCHFSVNAGAWGTAKSLYAVAGWLMVSGLIITLSGVVRRRIEG